MGGFKGGDGSVSGRIPSVVVQFVEEVYDPNIEGYIKTIGS